MKIFIKKSTMKDKNQVIPCNFDVLQSIADKPTDILSLAISYAYMRLIFTNTVIHEYIFNGWVNHISGIKFLIRLELHTKQRTMLVTE